MRKAIWKYVLDTTDHQAVEMPVGAEILTVQTQYNKPCMWALVDPSAEEEKRYFEIFGTGHDVNYDMGVNRKYIGTYQLDKGTLVFHVFEPSN